MMSTTKRHGFTLLELLIAVIIIGILVSIITVVYTNRAGDARKAAALKDLEALATGEEHASIDVSNPVRLHVLNDVRGVTDPGGGTVGDARGTGDPLDKIDAFPDEQFHTNALLPTQVFINYDTGTMVTATTAFSNAARSETGFGVWQGPYVNIPRRITPANRWGGNNNYTFDQPLDPWGNPYLLFTRGGMLVEPDGVITTTAVPWPPVGGSGSYAVDSFDRMTILSLGPDNMPGDAAVPGTTFGQGDDLFRQF